MSEFHNKHIGPKEKSIEQMLNALEEQSLNSLTEKVVPKNILEIDEESIGNKLFSENEVLDYMKTISEKNHLSRSLIGQGYYDTITPNVILRNILEKSSITKGLRKSGLSEPYFSRASL